MRLRLIARPFCSLRYACRRSSVQQPKGKFRSFGSVNAAATTSARCSAV
jgi:hypothetical protein